MTAWTDLVKKTYDQNKHKTGYELKHAMKDAKKVYKKGSHTHKKHMDTPYPSKSGGNCGTEPVNPFPPTLTAGGSRRKRSSHKGVKRGGKRRTKKSSCSMW